MTIGESLVPRGTAVERARNEERAGRKWPLTRHRILQRIRIRRTSSSDQSKKGQIERRQTVTEKRRKTRDLRDEISSSECVTPLILPWGSRLTAFVSWFTLSRGRRGRGAGRAKETDESYHPYSNFLPSSARAELNDNVNRGRPFRQVSFVEDKPIATATVKSR